jgi:hypothetical protein
MTLPGALTSRRSSRTWGILLLGVFLVGGLPAAEVGPSQSDGPQPDVLRHRAEVLAAQFKVQPDRKILTQLLHPNFLQSVPVEKITPLLVAMAKEHGGVQEVQLESQDGSYSGRYRFLFGGGVQASISLHLEAQSPYQVVGLRVGPAKHALADWPKLLEKLGKLPGHVGLEVARLGEKARVLASLGASEPMALGSTFKLYILGALVKYRIPWDRVVRLRAEDRSLPSGILQTWPVGSPLTVHSLATQMISISDNTATDTLLKLVGRRKVEAMLKEMGNSAPTRTVPFLSTREMFVLESHKALRQRYLSGNEKARRSILNQEVPGMEPAFGSLPRSPQAIDQLEWFASPSDLTRALDWLRVLGEETALDILGINRGLKIPEGSFPYAGYKGGSNKGVLNMSWLLRHKSGDWYVLTLGWNNPKQILDENRFYTLAQEALDLLARKLEKTSVEDQE